MKKELCKEEQSIKPTMVYHSIKAIIFAILFVLSAIPATLATIWESNRTVWIILLSLAIGICIMFFGFLSLIIIALHHKNSHLDYMELIWNDETRCIVFEGGQGSGKTDTMKRMAIIKADHQYKMLCDEYHLHYNLLPTYIANKDKRKLEEWEECRKVYEFYKAHPEIFPCLVSNTPMSVDGRMVMRFSFAMLVQECNIGYKTVLIIDEGKDAGLSNADSGAVPQEMDEIFRFMRQFYDGYIYTTEQNKLKIILELRNVSINYTMLKMDKDILRPRLLQSKLDRLRRKLEEWEGTYTLTAEDPISISQYVNINYFTTEELQEYLPLDAQYVFDKYYPKNTALAINVRNLMGRINKIGFIRYTRMKRSGTENNIIAENENKIYKYYMCCNRRYDSDTRLFRGINKAKHMQFKPTTWALEETTINRLYWDEQHEYRQQFRASKKTKKTK